MSIQDMGVNWKPVEDVQIVGNKSFDYPCSICGDDCLGHIIEPEPEPELEPLDWDLEKLERRHIEACLAAKVGNRTHAAKALGISVRSVQRKLKRWGIT